ncbi:MAG: hypothetical protein CFH05_00067 [Alphaproteobacteria bacterium MarineAlpha3_Bin4]|nr:MAG: hypothetical protein CFH05_00067 [Alphaproteobacteria bacterium MarineAlpha3_Bin4]
MPFNNSVNQIVHTEDSSAVESVMDNREFMLKLRQFTRIENAKLCREAENTINRLLAANAKARILAQIPEDMVSKICIGLADQAYHIPRWYGATVAS